MADPCSVLYIEVAIGDARRDWECTSATNSVLAIYTYRYVGRCRRDWEDIGDRFMGRR